MFRSYISSPIKPFKHNTIQNVRLLLRSQESNLPKPLTVLGIRLYSAPSDFEKKKENEKRKRRRRLGKQQGGVRPPGLVHAYPRPEGVREAPVASPATSRRTAGRPHPGRCPSRRQSQRESGGGKSRQ